MSKRHQPSLRVTSVKPMKSAASSEPMLVIMTGLAVDSTGGGVQHQYSADADAHVAVITRSPKEYRDVRKLIQTQLDIQPIEALAIWSRRFGELYGVNPLVYPTSALSRLKHLQGAQIFDEFNSADPSFKRQLKQFLDTKPDRSK